MKKNDNTYFEKRIILKTKSGNNPLQTLCHRLDIALLRIPKFRTFNFETNLKH